MKADVRADFPLITADPGTLFGKPRIRDTRISVADILELVADGATVAEIVEGWPELTREAVEQAIRYAAAVLEFPAAKRIAG